MFFQIGRHGNPFHSKRCCQLDEVKKWGCPYSGLKEKCTSTLENELFEKEQREEM